MSTDVGLKRILVIAGAAWFAVGAACSNGSGGSGGSGGCAGECAQPAGLSMAEVQQIVARGVAEAQANGVAATIAVVDRVGNVLVVAETTGAPLDLRIDGRKGALTGLDGLTTADLAPINRRTAAISKAGTGAYLSSQGNAFSTRTASQIVQENFNPGERFQAGGPLFGVQFSQFGCGDFIRVLGQDARQGPKALPLGFSADPGGLPLYKPSPDGVGLVPVGGVGVEVDGVYTLDLDIANFDASIDERVATAAASGHAAPADRRADLVPVAGRFLRFAEDERTLTPPGAVLPPAVGVTLPAVTGFYAGGSYLPGTTFLDPVSGIAADSLLLFTDEQGRPIPVEVITSGGDPNLYDPADSIDPPTPTGMSAAEVTVLLREALRVANRARGQIRRPQGSTARVNISVVDASGNILGFIRTADAPVFGADVSLQKARTAAFFSRPNAAMLLSAVPVALGGLGGRFRAPAEYVTDLQTLIPGALTNGVAFSDRAGGNLSRPFFPDGINGNPHGPLSRPSLPGNSQWSIFSTGLQLDFVVGGIVDSLGGGNLAACNVGLPNVPNGFQIFPGSVPIYRGSTLVGGIGISGDGVDQDDMVAFLGLHNASLQPGVGIHNASGPMRADALNVNGIRLRYVSCPPKPFVDSDQQNVCDGK